MNKNLNVIKLGIFVTFGIISFIAAIYYIGRQQNIFGRTFSLSVIFHNVSGLQVGNNIRFSGINVGTVTNLEIISDSTVKVHFIIEEKIRPFIKKDATAIISSEGLMGNKVVVITPGRNGIRVVENDDIIQSQKSIEIDDILKSLKAAAENSEILTADMGLILDRINTGEGIIGKLFTDTLLAYNIVMAVSNITQGTKEFNTNMAAFKNTINNISIITDNTAVITNDLAKITGKINAGEGMVGRLLMDTILSNNISQTMINIEQGTSGLNENMKALKNFFLFRKYYENQEKEKYAKEK